MWTSSSTVTPFFPFKSIPCSDLPNLVRQKAELLKAGCKLKVSCTTVEAQTDQNLEKSVAISFCCCSAYGTAATQAANCKSCLRRSEAGSPPKGSKPQKKLYGVWNFSGLLKMPKLSQVSQQFQFPSPMLPWLWGLICNENLEHSWWK